MMTYDEARMEMLALTGDAYFSMQESVPDRPCTWQKPVYRVCVIKDSGQEPRVYEGQGSSWKRAITALQVNMMAVAA